MIRAATLRDVTALVKIEKICFSDEQLFPFQFKNFIIRKNAITLVAIKNKKIVGYSLSLLRKNSVQSRLYSIAILPSYQGKGFAKALLKKTEEQVKTRGCKRIVLEVREDNHHAITFYKKQHYGLFGRYPHYYADKTNALRFLKNLAS